MKASKTFHVNLELIALSILSHSRKVNKVLYKLARVIDPLLLSGVFSYPHTSPFERLC